MKTVFRLVVLAGAFAAGVWLWGVLFPSPRAVIESRLNKVARLASFPAGQNKIVRGFNVERMCSLFASNVQITLDNSGADSESVGDRDELQAVALKASASLRSLQANFDDIFVAVNNAEGTASAELTLRAKINGGRDLLVQPLRFLLKKTDGDWLITRVETVKSLK